MSPDGQRHGFVCANTVHLLQVFVLARRRGSVVSNDTGFIVARDPDSVRSTDVAVFNENPRWDEIAVGFTDRIPALVVEVLSPNDRLGEVMIRVDNFLEMGVEAVWVVDSDARNVTVFRRGSAPQVCGKKEHVTAGKSLSDLSIAVAEIFAI